ncbi:Spy/CpxP family protein refolding chaperone [Pseudorhodoferax sp.]|uniref:Spy/CpxP family protein refolding chaperone n=1 Tax=Pseudorhodoferax sp. TaxID=1993553 RepID=UPI0039E41590
MRHPRLSFKRFVLAGAMAALAAGAIAQTPAAPPAAPPAAGQAPGADAQHPHQHRPRDGGAQRLARLKEQLKITPAQEPAWNAYTASLLPPPPPAERPPREDLRTLTTPQRIERLRALHAERTADMERRAEAVLRLYGALAPEQQQVFDRHPGLAMGFGPMHGPRDHHHRGPGRPG